ncbi:hypothetical protein OV450_6622 [Actinobacteria bacterium OV450]|nr:hypothetical protein OV450_6622 [Actinobacteria bacterium OV450]
MALRTYDRPSDYFLVINLRIAGPVAPRVETGERIAEAAKEGPR